MALLLETVTFSASGAGVVPAAAAPKLSDAWLSATERTDATSTSTCTDPLAPEADPPPQVCATAALLRGAGVPAAKSVAFSSVSVHPLPARRSASVADCAGADPAPSKSLDAP